MAIFVLINRASHDDGNSGNYRDEIDRMAALTAQGEARGAVISAANRVD